MSKAGCADFTAIGVASTRAYKIDSKFSLRCFYGCVCIAHWSNLDLWVSFYAPTLYLVNYVAQLIPFYFLESADLGMAFYAVSVYLEFYVAQLIPFFFLVNLDL